jgi:hypothetical protein
MTDPDTEHAAGPVTPQSPVISNYGLVLAVYILYLVGLPYWDNSPCRRSNRLSAKRQNGSNKPIAFPVSDNDLLDWSSLFFRWASDAALCNRRTNFALVGHLDGD